MRGHVRQDIEIDDICWCVCPYDGYPDPECKHCGGSGGRPEGQCPEKLHSFKPIEGKCIRPSSCLPVPIANTSRYESVTCDGCGGDGLDGADMYPCPDCKGTGEVVVQLSSDGSVGCRDLGEYEIIGYEPCCYCGEESP